MGQAPFFVIRDALVVFKENVTVGEVNELLKEIGGLVVGALPQTGTFLIRTPAIERIEQLESVKKQIRQSGLSAAVAPNFAGAIADFVEDENPNLSIQSIPSPTDSPDWRWDLNSPHSGANYGLEMCRVPQAWNLLTHGRRNQEVGVVVNIGVLDAGFYPGHPDLPESFILDSKNANPLGDSSRSHGTAVVGVIAANRDNSLAIDGINPLVGQIRGLPFRITADPADPEKFFSVLWSDTMEDITHLLSASPRNKIVPNREQPMVV